MAEWVRRAAFNTKVVGSNSAFVTVGGEQCHRPPQGGTGYGEMDEVSLLHGYFLSHHTQKRTHLRKHEKVLFFLRIWSETSV